MSSPTFELNDQLIRAGAGAGKTTTLTERVLEVASHIHQQEGRWPQIVVTTFTRKATQELRERLILEACKLGREDLLNYVSSPSQLFISTLHGVFSLFLRKYGHLFDYDAGFSLLTDSQAKQMARTELRKILLSSKSSEFSDLLIKYKFTNLYQAVWSFYSFKLENPESHYIKQEDISRCAQRTYNRWGAELDRVRDLVEMEVENEKWQIFAADLGAMISLLNSGKANIHEIREAKVALGRKPAVNKKIPADVNEELTSVWKVLGDEIKKPVFEPECWQDFEQTASLFEKLATRFSESFRLEKQRRGSLEIADLELLSLDALRNEPEICGCFSREWDYWMIDEYQDTSPIQVEILKHLIGDSKSFIVGDPQQSIYLFRGAQSELFSKKEKELQDGGSLTQLKMKNYRSQPELLLFFNDLFTELDPQFSAMEPKAEPKTGVVKTVAKFAIAEEGGVENRSEHEDLAILNHVIDLLEKNVEPGEICILARKNRDVGELAQYLKSHGIPTQLHSSAGYFDRREIQDALALLKFLANPSDNANTLEVLRSPWCRVSDSSLFKAVHERPKVYWDKIREHCSEEFDSVGKLQSFLEDCRVKGVSHVFESALVEFGFFDLSHFHDSTGKREANVWKLITSLREQERMPGFNIIDFVTAKGGELEDLDSLEEGEAIAASEPNRVNLMTVHASKGLQFKHVLLVRTHKAALMLGGSKPLFQGDGENKNWSIGIPFGIEASTKFSLAAEELFARRKQRELSEFDRVLYVALTRAKESVFISWVDKLEKNCWVSRLPFDFSQEVVKREHYSYQVDRGPWSSRSYKSEESDQENMKSRVFSWDKDETQKSRFSVSSLLEEKMHEIKGSAVESQVELFKTLSRPSRGVLVHSLLETVKYHGEEYLPEMAKRWFGDDWQEVQEAVSYVSQLESPNIREIMSSGEVEWGFQLNTKRGVLEGQIDLWGFDKEENLWVVDYKSGSDAFREKAFKQLEIYSLALSKIYGGRSAKLAVVYPFSAKCEFRDAGAVEQILATYGL